MIVHNEVKTAHIIDKRLGKPCRKSLPVVDEDLTIDELSAMQWNFPRAFIRMSYQPV